MKKLAILKTLHYADIFDFPLTADEIHKYLVEPLTIEVLKETLSQMSADGGYYCLLGREEIIRIRQQRERWSGPKLKKARKVVSLLKLIPWIKLVGVTGALAMENSDADGDIDLMIITSPQRLWLTRGLVVTFLRLIGQYRRPGKIKDMVCPNLMISEEALEFPDHDLFTAHEIVQMKPVFDRGGVCQKFLEANQWVKEFLPNAIKTNSKLKTQNSKPQLKSQNLLLNLLERFAYRLQLKYMRSKQTTEVTTPSIIRFHPQDIRRRVLEEYQRRVDSLKISG